MYEILPYSPEKESRWDRFVMDESMNGTFLQTRKFLNYHPEGRFSDASFLIEKSGIVVAVVPGCTELLEYALENKGFTRHTELSCYTPLSKDVDPLENCKRECRHNYRQAEKLNLTYGEIPDSEMEKFYEFLILSKARHNTKPVHTLSELRDLKGRFPEEILFRGIWKDGVYLSGMMIFVFRQAKTYHFQYLAPDDNQRETNATTALYVNVMREAAQNEFERFSWGISTEDGGKYLNENLYRFKENFGALPCLNARFEK